MLVGAWNSFLGIRKNVSWNSEEGKWSLDDGFQRAARLGSFGSATNADDDEGEERVSARNEPAAALDLSGDLPGGPVPPGPLSQ